MMNKRAVMSILDCRAGLVEALVEDGKLLWTFDVRSKKAKRKDLRVLFESVAAYAANTAQPSAREAFNRILSRDVVELTGPEVRRALNISDMHLVKLVREGEVKYRPGKNLGRGPLGMFSVESLISFLKRRRYPSPL